MNVLARVQFSEQFEIDGKRFVKLSGFINDLGVFKYTVREELVPDSIEGKECVFMFSVGLDGFCKPKLVLKGISLDTSLADKN